MKKVLKVLSDIIILLAVIGLYVLAFNFIYSNFRERKRKEISDNVLEKVEDHIKNDKGNNNNTEKSIKYGGYRYTVLGTIRINKLRFSQPILKENTYGAYNVSVVKMKGPNLNEIGNVVIGGHNYMRSNYFMKINRLVKNDVVIITDLKGRSVKYYVYAYGSTSPDDPSYFENKKDGRYVTLVTCDKGGKARYYVKAKAK